MPVAVSGPPWRALAEAGADIIAISASMTADGGDVGERVRALGRTFQGIACYVSDRSAIQPP
ncbi:hypothetical protein [Cobetia marina]|uniref:hypothetical protein n=1 Tax=Cobetia marina TaxID=28258 RepID=UPI00174CAB5F